MEPHRRPRRGRRRRAQHLLHPRERRQQAVRQPRPPEALKDERPGLQIVGRRLPGPEGPRPRPRAGAARRRRVRHPQRRTAPPSCSREARAERPDHRDPRGAVLDDHALFPSALPARRETSLHRVGHDPDRLRQHAARSASCPSVRGAEISRPFGDIVDEVERARRRRRHRGHAARPERQLLRPRPHLAARGRRHDSRAAAVRRPARAPSARSTASAGSASQPAPEGPAARDDRRDGRDAARCASTCTPAAVRQRPRRWPRMHRGYTAERYLERLAAARAAIADLAVTTDIIVGFPGETDDDFERTLEVVAAAEYDGAYTFIFSPRPGTEAADDDRRLRRPDVVARAVRAAARRRRAHARCAKHEARVGRVEEVLVEGPRKTRPVGARPAAPARTSSCTSRRRAGARRRRYADGRDHRAPRRTTSRGRFVERRRRARAHACASRSPPADAARRPVVDRRADRVGQVATSALARRRAAAGDVEIVAVDSMQVYRGMDIGTAKPTRRRAGRGAAPLHRPRRPGRGLHRRRVPGGGRRGARRHRRPRRTGRCSSAAPASTCARSSTGSTRPAGGPTCAPSSTPSRDTVARCTRRLAALDPVGRRRAWSRRNRRRIVRALEVTIGSGRPFSSFGPGARRLPADRRRADRPALAPRRRWPSASSSAFARDARPPASLDEVARLAADAGRPVPHRPPGARLQGAARPPRRRVLASPRRSRAAMPAPASSPSARSGGSAATPAYAGSTSTDDPVAAVLAAPRRALRRMTV